jgi:two-component system, cell cycle sensor histidine kinase and response regulator CckA
MNVSIRTRLTLIILGITLGTLAVGFTLVAVRQIDSFRAQRVQAMAVIANVVGDSSVSALAFGDKADAENTLAQLGEFPDIEAAALYDADGALFATYSREASGRVTRWPEAVPAGAPEIRRIGDEEAQVRLPVVYDDETYGTIELIATNAALDEQISSFITTLIVISLALIVMSVLAAMFLQRRITRPIFELADLARRVTSAEDTSLRAGGQHTGEIGTLAIGFNAMLAKLEAREREVVSSRDTLRAVIDASPVAIIGIDPRGVITLWNSRAEEIFRKSQADSIGRPLAAVASEASLAPIWKRCAAESFFGVEVELASDRALSVTAAPLPDGGAMILVADVTERRRAAEALAERATQLQRAQKMDVVGRLAGGVAHDFNNLLTVILASCQMLHLRSGGRPELKNYIDNVLNAAQRGSALSRRLLAFSRQQALDARMIDARNICTDLERMVRSVVGENIDVQLDQIDVPCTVLVDQGQLEQVLLNMVLNARDAMPTGGTLTLKTRAIEADGEHGPKRSGGAGQWIGISVADTGVGMSPETVARVFEPFYTTKANGTGLGLATADQITRDLGGEITVKSELGRGTTFTLWLPRIGGAEARATEIAHPQVVPGNDTVLLVEDEIALRNLVQILLAEAGYHVIAAASPQEALALGTVPGVSIDLLLTDVVMPSMSGPQLATELLRRRPDIQVLYMSGYVGDALTEHGLDEAAAAIIHKPFKPDQLLKLIRDLLDARPARRSRRASEAALFGRSGDPGTA